MVIQHGQRHHLEPGITHVIPIREHRQTRWHHAYLDVTQHLNPNTVISVQFEVSTDGGKTWTGGGGFTSRGGIALDKRGDPLTHVSASFGHEPTPRHRDHSGRMVGADPAPHRLIRGTVTIDGYPVTTALTIEGS